MVERRRIGLIQSSRYAAEQKCGGMREIELNQSQRVITKKRQNRSLNREKQLTDRILSSTPCLLFRFFSQIKVNISLQKK